MILFWCLIFFVALSALIWASNLFTEMAAKIGLLFHVPPFIIGVTVVALGTSLPELISSIIAVYRDSSEIVAGNVLGSNITNIFLILGIIALLEKNVKMKYDIGSVDMPFLIGGTFLYAMFIFDKKYTFFEAVLSLIVIALYLIYSVSGHVTSHNANSNGTGKKEKLTPWLYLLLSGFIVYLGANFTIEAILKISDHFHLGKSVIAASAVALGTSLPELVVSISAVRQGHSELAIGNILGSNIFNMFAVMSIPSFLGPLFIETEMVIIILPILIVATLMFYFITNEKQMTKWEGALLLVFYLFFLTQLFSF